MNYQQNITRQPTPTERLAQIRSEKPQAEMVISLNNEIPEKSEVETDEAENWSSHCIIEDETGQNRSSHCIILNSFNSLYNEMTTQEEAACAAYKAPLAQAAPPQHAAHASNGSNRTREPATQAYKAAPPQEASPLHKGLPALSQSDDLDVDNLNHEASEKENDSAAGQDDGFCPPKTRRKPIGSVVPPFESITRIYAQIFPPSCDSKGQRKGLRTVKLVIWTTDDVEKAGNQAYASAICYFPLNHPEAMFKAIQRNFKSGTITPLEKEVLETLATDLRKKKRHGLERGQESPTMAYLSVKGCRATKQGTEIFPSEVAVVEWKKTEDGEFLPCLSLFIGGGGVEIICLDLRKRNDNSKAAQFAAYHDPIDYNNFRKKKIMTKAKILPTAEYLHSRLSYNEETGVLNWKPYLNPVGWQKSWNKRWAGKNISCTNTDGYIVFRLDDVSQYAHRIIWKMTHPDFDNVSLQIDHKSGVKSDNRLCNLRLVSQSQNMMNTKAKGYEKTRNGRYSAYIKEDGKKLNLGRFNTAEEAHEMYCKAADILYGEYAAHNSRS